MATKTTEKVVPISASTAWRVKDNTTLNVPVRSAGIQLARLYAGQVWRYAKVAWINLRLAFLKHRLAWVTRNMTPEERAKVFE